MQTSSAPLTRSSLWSGLGWPAVAFSFVIVVFGAVLIGHAPKWPIYLTILIWWAFVIYTTIHINHQKEASMSGG
jgi:hypothetical protein